MSPLIARGSRGGQAYSPFADLFWCETAALSGYIEEEQIASDPAATESTARVR